MNSKDVLRGTETANDNSRIPSEKRKRCAWPRPSLESPSVPDVHVIFTIVAQMLRSTSADLSTRSATHHVQDKRVKGTTSISQVQIPCLILYQSLCTLPSTNIDQLSTEALLLA